MTSASAPVRVAVAGLLRGGELPGDALLTLTDDAIELATARGRIAVPLAAIEGVRSRGSSVELYLDTGDVIVLDGPPELAGLPEALTRRVCTIPELTLSLRGLGSRRAEPGAEHDRFFEALLDARRAAERAPNPDALRAAFDAEALRASLGRRLHEFAAERYPRQAPERRALEAELTDCAEALLVSLEKLERAQHALAAVDETERFARWREWSTALRRVFEHADACWLTLRPVLAERPERPSRWRRWLRLSGALVAVALPARSQAQHVTLRVTGVSADSLRAHGFDVIGGGRDFSLVVASGAERTRLATLGASAVPIPSRARPGAPRVAELGPTLTTVYRPFDDPARGVAFLLDSLARANPLVHLDTIGRSVEGRPVLVVKVGASDDSPSRPNVLFMGTYHAREWAATEVALRLIRYLSTEPAPDARVDSLRQRRDVWILPVVNPDGYQFTFTTDRLWRKNRRPPDGVDLNRNHSTEWGRDNTGSSPDPHSEVYRGPAPESEPETRAVVAFHAAHPPVLAVSYHSYAELILFPWGYDYGLLNGDLGIFRALAGTDLRPSVRDHLPAPGRDHYHPAPSWNLYITNGEYTDWAYTTHRTLAFTVELTSGLENGEYYGFEFPDDEARLETLFQDILPFALDVLDAAADPLRVASANTGIPSERIGVESVSPRVRVRVPTADAASAALSASAPLRSLVDTLGRGRYTSRLVSDSMARPAEVRASASGVTKAFTVLAASGAEEGEAGWTASGFEAVPQTVAGRRAWAGGSGSLRSPLIPVPAGVDSVSVLFWTRYLGNPFDPTLHGEVRVSTDSGATWTLAGVLVGNAPAYYPERVDVVGVAGRSLVVEFDAGFAAATQTWWLDEITVVGHGASQVAQKRRILLPSANPVRGDAVRFTWPFEAEGGDLRVYDFAGRLVWRTTVTSGVASVSWPIAERGVRNGVYLVVAQAGSERVRLKLFVVRGRA